MENMKLTVLAAAIFISIAGIAPAQTYTQTSQSETKYVTVDGEVIRYEPGHVIVIRGADNKEVIYALSPSVTVPAEVKIGRKVTLYTEPGVDGGTQLVTRVTTTSVTPEGNVKRTTEDTRTLPSGNTTRTTTTTISGKVEAYEVGKALTIIGPNGSKVTYILTARSKVPADLVIGRTVTILPLVPSGSSEPIAQTVTYTTVTQPEEVPEH
jgi:hypothetical protein